MILRRLGNKKAIAKEIIPLFPKHRIYIEPFFGAGGIFFNKPQAEHSYLNDYDYDVYNLFKCVLENGDKLYEIVDRIPVSEAIFYYLRDDFKPKNEIEQAYRFLILSNFSL